MARQEEGFTGQDLQNALADALAGRASRLEELLAWHGALPSRPNMKLAAAFGTEMAAASGQMERLLRELASGDAEADDPRAFLPIAAAFGWAGRIRAGREVEAAFTALAQLACDERTPVRLGTRDALVDLGVRDGGEELLRRAHGWLALPDRQDRFAVFALLLEVLGDKRVLATIGDEDALLDYLSRVMREIAEAPRAAERSEARRRALQVLPATLNAALSRIPGDRGSAWLAAECEAAAQPQLREALSRTIIAVGKAGRGRGGAVADTLRQALEGSAKPLRDPTRVRPGSGRGRRSRPIR